MYSEEATSPTAGTTAGASIEILHVVPGQRCNLTCAHCATSSGPTAASRVNADDFAQIEAAVRSISPPRLLFTGGEPTFYIDEINRIVDCHPDPSRCIVQITTNGWFARSAAGLSAVLGRIKKLDHVQLSHDKYHGLLLPDSQIGALIEWTAARGIEFNISVAITCPEDMAFADDLQRRTGATVLYTRMEAAGRARENGLQFHFPMFERGVLNERCPNRKSVTYLPRRGFTVCCANLAFSDDSDGFVHANLEEHLSSAFYREIQDRTMGEMLESRGISAEGLAPEYSSACRLCELVQRHPSSRGTNGR